MAETGLIVNQSTRLVIMIMMIIAVGFAYFQMTKLDVNESAHNSLDNFLCLMCLPAFFVFGVFSMIPGIIYSHVLAVISVLSEVLTPIFLSQSLLQNFVFPPGHPSGYPDHVYYRRHVEVEQHQTASQTETWKGIRNFSGNLQRCHVDYANVRS